MKILRKKRIILGIIIAMIAVGISPFMSPDTVRAAVPVNVNLSTGWNTLATPIKLHTTGGYLGRTGCSQ